MSIIIMILLLSVLILVHEAGHFLAARAFGMKVERFGFGLPIGPVLFQTQWGDTKILVHALLLGGYVGFPDDDKDCELAQDSSERFQNKPIYQRAVVVSAGVIANVICAFVFVFLTAALWGHIPSGKYNIFVNDITAAKGESVWQSGLQEKDKFVAINGEKVNSTYALLSFIRLSKTNDGKTEKSLIAQNYTKLKGLNPPLLQDEIIPKDVAIKLPEKTFEAPVHIDKKVLKGMEKYKDTQISLTSKQIKLRKKIENEKIFISDGTVTLNDVAAAISDNSHPINLQVQRNGKIIDLKPVIANEKGLIGVKLEAQEILIPTKGAKDVFVAGTKYLWDNTYMMVYGLAQLFTGKVDIKDLHGIVAITKIGGDVIQNNGIFEGLLLIAIISMDLAIVNFLPIPALDGGHILFLIIEKLRGKPVEEKVAEKIGNVCFYALLALMFFVIANDIFGLITKKF